MFLKNLQDASLSHDQKLVFSCDDISQLPLTSRGDDAALELSYITRGDLYGGICCKPCCSMDNRIINILECYANNRFQS